MPGADPALRRTGRRTPGGSWSRSSAPRRRASRWCGSATGATRSSTRWRCARRTSSRTSRRAIERFDASLGAPGVPRLRPRPARSGSGAPACRDRPGRARERRRAGNVTPLRVVVVGGGHRRARGRAPARRARAGGARPLDLVLLEAAGRLGGTIRTERADGFLLEAGPDSFISEKPWALALAERIGLGPRLRRTDDRFRRTYVVRARPAPPAARGVSPAGPDARGTGPEVPRLLLAREAPARAGSAPAAPAAGPETRASGASCAGGSGRRRSSGWPSPSSEGSTRRTRTACPWRRPCRDSSRSSGSTGA